MALIWLQVGGNIGFGLGLSLVSVAEIIYWFTLRIYRNSNNNWWSVITCRQCYLGYKIYRKVYSKGSGKYQCLCLFVIFNSISKFPNNQWSRKYCVGSILMRHLVTLKHFNLSILTDIEVWAKIYILATNNTDIVT